MFKPFACMPLIVPLTVEVILMCAFAAAARAEAKIIDISKRIVKKQVETNHRCWMKHPPLGFQLENEQSWEVSQKTRYNDEHIAGLLVEITRN